MMFDLFRRLNRALGPILGGMILDFADLITFGPLGLYTGWFVGPLVGLWISSIYRFPIWGRIAAAIAATAYCVMPFTAPFPMATIAGAIARFFETKKNDVDPT